MRYVLAFYLMIGIVQGEVLQVKVKDALTGEPLQASVIVAGKVPFMATGLTDRNGLALLEVPSLDPLAVGIRAMGYGTGCYGQKDVQRSRIDAALIPALRVYGTIEDSAGNPLAGATVAVEYTEDNDCRVRFDTAGQVQSTDDQGQYVLRDVDVGKDFRIVARHPQAEGRTVTKAEILIGNAVVRTHELDFRLPQP